MNRSESYMADNLPFVCTEQVVSAITWIVLNPLFWTFFAQIELRTRLLTKLAGGNKYVACYAYSAAVFSMGMYRNHVFREALISQPAAPLLDYALVKAAGAILLGAGGVLVVTSMWALGVTGTYNGDYFGILMDERITSFPFSVVENPMYFGSYLSFVGTALYYGKPVGVLLSAFVWLMYSLALHFESPYTARIYAKRDARKAAVNNNVHRLNGKKDG